MTTLTISGLGVSRVPGMIFGRGNVFVLSMTGSDDPSLDVHISAATEADADAWVRDLNAAINGGDRRGAIKESVVGPMVRLLFLCCNL